MRPLHDYVVEVAFADGTVREYDFAGRLSGPMFAPLRDDYMLFQSVRVDPEIGTVVWPVGDDRTRWPDWAPEDPYEHSRARAEDASYRQFAEQEDEDRPLRSLRGRPRRLAGARVSPDATRADLTEHTDVVLDADLNAEDDDGRGNAVVPFNDFTPSAVYPGARVRAGRTGASLMVVVLRTELIETPVGQRKVVVTFDKHG